MTEGFPNLVLDYAAFRSSTVCSPALDFNRLVFGVEVRYFLREYILFSQVCRGSRNTSPGVIVQAIQASVEGKTLTELPISIGTFCPPMGKETGNVRRPPTSSEIEVSARPALWPCVSPARSKTVSGRR